MAELRLDEVVVDAVIAKLQHGLPDRVGQINAEKAASDANNLGYQIQISAPDPTWYFTGRVPQLPATPSIFVLAGPGQFKESGPHSLGSVYEIHVHVIESAQTGPELARRLMRQERAVLEVLYDDDPKEALYVAGSDTVLSAFRIFPLRTVPGTVFAPSGQDSWRGSYLIVFRAEQEEM